MGVPYAEVIGDPIAHSKSPLIHKFWLEKLGLEGDYRATRVTANDLPAYFGARLADPAWLGCNVTMPLKQAIQPFLGSTSDDGSGAINCVTIRGGELVGTNTDSAGLAEALSQVTLKKAKVCLIGSGGAASAAATFLREQPITELVILARDHERATVLAQRVGRRSRAVLFDNVPSAMSDASVIINATPMGMDGQPPMELDVIDWLAHLRAGATVLDMVYSPPETELLHFARRIGFVAVDGLTMLTGQAAAAFSAFFKVPAPREYDAELRELLTQ